MLSIQLKYITAYLNFWAVTVQCSKFRLIFEQIRIKMQILDAKLILVGSLYTKSA